MLKSISVKNLFNQYDYEISLEGKNPGGEDGLLFITGPNGMGKSTILRLTSALYEDSWGPFLDTPFQTITYKYDTCTILISRSETLEEKEANDDTPSEGIIKVTCDFTTHGETPVTEHGEWGMYKRIISKNKIPMKNMEMFFKSEESVYVPDNRIDRYGNNGQAFSDPKVLERFITDLQSRFNANFVKNTSPFSEILDADDVLKTLRFLSSCELNLNVSPNDFTPETIPENILACASNAITNCTREIDTLKAFAEFLDSCMFLDKDVQLSPKYGYTFYARDEKRSILDFYKLSLGEQHIFCQFYTLFFTPIHYSLVLIDEPELSFHVMWQMEYINNIRNLRSLRGGTYLIATHSNNIFGGRFELTTDLWAQHKNRES